MRAVCGPASPTSSCSLTACPPRSDGWLTGGVDEPDFNFADDEDDEDDEEEVGDDAAAAKPVSPCNCYSRAANNVAPGCYSSAR